MTTITTKLRGCSLDWQYTEHWSGEQARTEICGLRLGVQDYDGDGTGWVVKSGKTIVASGEFHGPDDFVICAQRAEAAAREIIAARLAELRSLGTEVKLQHTS